MFKVNIKISPKAGVLDTQGKAVCATLRRMGHDGIRDVRVGRYIQLVIDAESSGAALAHAKAMCDELLVNDLIEEYTAESE